MDKLNLMYKRVSVTPIFSGIILYYVLMAVLLVMDKIPWGTWMTNALSLVLGATAGVKIAIIIIHKEMVKCTSETNTTEEQQSASCSQQSHSCACTSGQACNQDGTEKRSQ